MTLQNPQYTPTKHILLSPFTLHSQTMFFQKSIISLFAAIALATSISASSIALRDYPQCPSGLSPYCCTQAIPFSSLSDGPKTALPGAASDLDQSKPVCLGGAAPPAQGWCVSPPLLFPASHEMANTPL